MLLQYVHLRVWRFLLLLRAMMPLLVRLLLVFLSRLLCPMMLKSLVSLCNSLRFLSTFSCYGCLDFLSALLSVILGPCLAPVNGPASRAVSGEAVFSDIFTRYSSPSPDFWSGFGDAARVRESASPLLRETDPDRNLIIVAARDGLPRRSLDLS